MSSKLLRVSALLIFLGAPLRAEPVALYGRWGVFRDGRSCRAVTMTEDGAWLAVAGDRLVSASPSRPARSDKASLIVGRTQVSLPGLRADGAAGAALIAALRRGTSATLVTTDLRGGRRRDRFPLGQAALALDAAVVACAR